MSKEIALILDPSSTKTGYARVREDGKVLEAGLIRPLAKALFTDRVITTVEMVGKLLDEDNYQRIVIEIPSGKVNRSKNPSGSGLTRYGFAAGAVFWECYKNAAPVEAISETQWTAAYRINGGQIKTKRQRALGIATACPAYLAQMAKDSGFDMADAIGLGLWYWENLTIRSLV